MTTRTNSLRVVGLEEHFVTSGVLRAWQAVEPQWQDLALAPSAHGHSGQRLAELDVERTSAMDDAGLDVQVLSLSTPGVQNLEPSDAAALAAATNDLLAATVARRPDRFGGFATLPTPEPAAAADELRRAGTTLGLEGAMVFGRTRERTMDAPEFWPIYEAAADLRAPLHLIPSPRPAPFGRPSTAASATH